MTISRRGVECRRDRWLFFFWRKGTRFRVSIYLLWEGRVCLSKMSWMYHKEWWNCCTDKPAAQAWCLYWSSKCNFPTVAEVPIANTSDISRRCCLKRAEKSRILDQTYVRKRFGTRRNKDETNCSGTKRAKLSYNGKFKDRHTQSTLEYLVSHNSESPLLYCH